MNGFEYHFGVGLKVFAQFGDKNIHAAAQEVIVFSPYIQQYFFSFQNILPCWYRGFQAWAGRSRKYKICGAPLKITEGAKLAAFYQAATVAC